MIRHHKIVFNIFKVRYKSSSNTKILQKIKKVLKKIDKKNIKIPLIIKNGVTGI